MPDLTDLPAGVLGMICDLAHSPADIHNLHLVNKTTYHKMNEDGEAKGSGSGKSDFTRTMGGAMDRSMARALSQSKAGANRNIDIFNTFVKLANSLPPGSVAMSGSIVVQAMLGEQWGGSDIDVYCTKWAAPSVRTWIISELKQVLVGICSRYTRGPVHRERTWTQ